MNISGVLVHSRPERLAEVAAALATLAGVEVQATTEDGRLVVTVEEPEGVVGRTILQIGALSGVLSASVVYQQSEADFILEENSDVVHTA